MKIDYLFSKNKKIGSKIISWAASFEKLNLEHIPSHVAVLLDDIWVIESTLFTGVRIIPYSRWQQINTELYKIPCSDTSRDSASILRSATKVWDKDYDWFGILFFALSFLNLIINKKKLPKINKWQNKRKYFCTEFVGLLTDNDFSMISPAKLCEIWLTRDDITETN